MHQVGVFFGSRSPEHDISILTAMRVIAGFRALSAYHAVPVYISKKGEWFAGEALGDLAFFQTPRLEERLMACAVASFSFHDGALILLPRPRFLHRAQPTRIDIAFPCFHGSFGEDGTIQGLFEMAGIPYVGCGVRASAIAMSKIHTRRFLNDIGIPAVPTQEIARESFSRDRNLTIQNMLKDFSFPLFVKPNSLGSSIAVSRVVNEKELEWALEVAFQFDNIALVEKAIENLKEVNVAVMGHHGLMVSETEEPRFKAEFQTFEQKYLIKGGTLRQGKGKAKSKIPAELPENLQQTFKDTARKAYQALSASGISRFDFLVDMEKETWYLGEVNPLPGSLQAHVWEASGVPLPQLLEKLIGFAEERFEEEKPLTRIFSSSVLQK